MRERVIDDRSSIAWLCLGIVFGMGCAAWLLPARVPEWVLLVGLAAGVLAATMKANAPSRRWLFGFIGLVAGAWRFGQVSVLLPPVRLFDPNAPLMVARTMTSADAPTWIQERRERLTSRITHAIPGDDGILVAGVLYGERGMTSSTRRAFRDAGLLHVIAVSGANVAWLVLMASFVLHALGMGIRARLGVLSLGIFGFILFAGGGASILRAGIMAIVTLAAPLAGRIARPMWTLLFTATVLAWWQPWAPFFDIGFQLSFLCMIALCTWTPWLSERLPTWLPGETLRTSIAASLSTAVWTAPLTMWLFQTWSVWGVLCSVLAGYLIPGVTMTGLVFLAFPHPWTAAFAERWAEGLRLISAIPNWIGFGVFQDIWFSWQWVIACYVLLIGSVFRIRSGQIIHMHGPERVQTQ